MLPNKYLVILREALPALKSRYPIAQLALFGSALRNDFDDKQSDIDIMVELTQPDALAFIRLAEELEKLYKRKVDLVSRNGIKPKYFEFIKPDLVYV